MADISVPPVRVSGNAGHMADHALINTDLTALQAQADTLAPLDSPALTGTPTAPTQTASNNSTRLATTAYADTAVGVEATRATTAEGLKLVKSSNLSDVASPKTARNNLGAGFNLFHAVVDYGAATGGTSAANRTAIQNCLNAAAAANGTAYIPAGTFHISGAALTCTSYTKIQGDSFYGTVIVQDSANTDILQLMGADSSHLITGCEVRDISFQGPGKASGSTGVGLNLNWADDTNIFSRLYINNQGSHGVNMQNSYVTAFRDCWFYYNGGDGFHAVTSVNAVSWNNCSFSQNAGNGAYLSGIAASNVLGCDFESNANHGLWMVNCYSATVLSNDFENNSVGNTNTYDSLRIDHTQGYSGPVIMGNNFTGTGGVTKYGVNLLFSTSAYVDGNTFVNFGTGDISIDSNSTGAVIGKSNIHQAGSGPLVADLGTGTIYLGVPDVPDLPSDYGFTEWNYNPYQAGTPSSSLAGFTAGVVFGARLTIRRPRNLTKVAIMWYPGTGTAAVHSYFALVNSAGTTVATSSDISATAAGLATVTFTTTNCLPGNYWVAVLVGTQSTTTNAGAYINPNCVSAGVLPATGAGIAAASAKWVKLGNLTSQSSIPGSFTLANSIVSAVPFWCAVI